jgi:HK97 family phage major capsid protein
MTLAEKIASLEAKRLANVARMEAIQKAGDDEGRTMNQAESDEFDTLSGECEQIDGDLVRAKNLQKLQVAAAKATPKPADVTMRDATASRDVGTPSIVLRQPELPPGIAFARYVKCVWRSKTEFVPVLAVAEKLYPKHKQLHDFISWKAAVPGGTTSHTTWAGPLVGDESAVFADFVEFLRPLTIVGRFGTNGIPALRRVPFRTRLPGQTSGGAGYWVGEGKAKPLTRFAFASTTLTPLKVANIAVTTKELLRDSSPSAEALVRDGLVGALRERMDLDFIDPTKALSAGVSPASISNGIAQINSTGNDADAVREDVRLLFGAFIDANNAPTNGVWIMSAKTALALSLMRNPLGQREFPGITMMGGDFEGLPAIVSQYVPVDSGGHFVFLVNASDIYFADEGEIEVDMSMEASLQMDDAPTQESDSPPTATQVVSLWQTDSVGFKAERTVNWKRRRESAVAVLNNVDWGQPAP